MTWKSKCVYVRALTSPSDFWLWEHNSFIEQIFIKSVLYARVYPNLWRYSIGYSCVLALIEITECRVCSVSSGYSDIVSVRWNYVVLGAPQVENHYMVGADMHISDRRLHHYLQNQVLSFEQTDLSSANDLNLCRHHHADCFSEVAIPMKGWGKNSCFIAADCSIHIERARVKHLLGMTEAVAFISPLHFIAIIYNFDHYLSYPNSQTYQWLTYSSVAKF